MKKNPSPEELLSDALVFEVAKRWLTAKGEEQKKLTTSIAVWLVKEHARELSWLDRRASKKEQVDRTRFRIYRIVREAAARNFVSLHAPRAVAMQNQLFERYDLDHGRHDISVVDVEGDVNNMVAKETADIALRLILKLGQDNLRDAPGGKEENAEPVGLGIGAGYSTHAVVTHLSRMLNTMPDAPRLRLHALTPTIAATKISPVTFFSLFRSDRNEYVDLPTTATVRCRDYEELKTQDVNIRHAFELRDRVQLIITSLGAADDPHGTIRQYLDYRHDRPELGESGMIGDIQYLPYDEKAPILLNDNHGWRAVTLFDWPDLMRFAEDPSKHLVLCAGPCRTCNITKDKALVPLLKHIRVWRHLVVDRLTAMKLLPGDEQGDPA